MERISHARGWTLSWESFLLSKQKRTKKRRWIVSQRFDRFLPSFTDCYRVSPVYRVDTKDQRHGGFIDCGFFYVDFLLSNLLFRPHHGGRTAQASRRRRAGAAAAAEPPTQRRRCRSVSSVVADRCRFRAALSDFFFPSTPHTSAPSRPGKEEPKTTPFLFYWVFFFVSFFLKKKGGGVKSSLETQGKRERNESLPSFSKHSNRTIDTNRTRNSAPVSFVT